MIPPRPDLSTSQPDNPATTGRLLHDYGLSLVLLVLFLGSWIVQTVSGWVEFVGTQLAHGAEPAILGRDGYAWTWLEATFENWQSEFLQLLSFVVLTAFLYHRGSHESKDGDEQQQALLLRIDERLARLEAARAGGPPT